MTNVKNKIMAKYKDGGPIGQDGNPSDLIITAFVGCDGRKYRVELNGEDLYVNGAKMESNDDKPCEFISKCTGNNQNCSYATRKLDGPKDERCAFYNDHIELVALSKK
jgi:hypothetical protein